MVLMILFLFFFFLLRSKPDRKKLAERLGLKDSQVWLIVYKIAVNI